MSTMSRLGLSVAKIWFLLFISLCLCRFVDYIKGYGFDVAKNSLLRVIRYESIRLIELICLNRNNFKPDRF